jgi:hypothetical protein
MDIFSKIAEQRIREAIENGEFEDLKNTGRPIAFEDETWVPEDLRTAYRVLKNAGCIPHELQLRKEVLSLRDLIHTIDDDSERLRKIRELNFKLIKLGEMRKSPLNLERFPEYEKKIFEKLTES